MPELIVITQTFCTVLARLQLKHELGYIATISQSLLKKFYGRQHALVDHYGVSMSVFLRCSVRDMF